MLGPQDANARQHCDVAGASVDCCGEWWSLGWCASWLTVCAAASSLESVAQAATA